jgi:hypothetical protein
MIGKIHTMLQAWSVAADKTDFFYLVNFITFLIYSLAMHSTGAQS